MVLAWCISVCFCIISIKMMVKQTFQPPKCLLTCANSIGCDANLGKILWGLIFACCAQIFIRYTIKKTQLFCQSTSAGNCCMKAIIIFRIFITQINGLSCCLYFTFIISDHSDERAASTLQIASSFKVAGEEITGTHRKKKAHYPATSGARPTPP